MALIEQLKNEAKLDASTMLHEAVRKNNENNTPEETTDEVQEQ